MAFKKIRATRRFCPRLHCAELGLFGANQGGIVARLLDRRQYFRAPAFGEMVWKESAVTDDHTEVHAAGIVIHHLIITSYDRSLWSRLRYKF